MHGFVLVTMKVLNSYNIITEQFRENGSHIREIDGAQWLTPFVSISSKMLTEHDFQRVISINLD